MIIVDTNVVSEMMHPSPHPVLKDWFDRQPPYELFVSAVTEAELRYGIELLPFGRRRSELTQGVERILVEELGNRIVPFDSQAAKLYALIMAGRRAMGREIRMADCMIAATARSHDAAIATRDTGGFQHCGIEVINPWGSA